MQPEAVLGQDVERGALDARRRAAEAPVDDRLVEAQRLEDLRALVARECGDAHLGHDLEDAAVAAVLEVANQLVVSKRLLNKALAVELEDALHGQVRVHGINTVAHEDAHVVHLARLGRLDHQRRHGAPLVAD